MKTQLGSCSILPQSGFPNGKEGRRQADKISKREKACHSATGQNPGRTLLGDHSGRRAASGCAMWGKLCVCVCVGGQFLSSGSISVLFPGSQALSRELVPPPELQTDIITITVDMVKCLVCAMYQPGSGRYQAEPPLNSPPFLGEGRARGRSEENMNRKMQRLYKASGLGARW